MSSVLTGKGIAFILIALLAGVGVGGFIVAPVIYAGNQQQQNLVLTYALGGYQLSGTLYITGSTTVFPITQNMIPNFQAQYPTITVQASGTGSGTGYSSVITSQSNIAAVSRPPTSSEISLATANGVKLVGWTIGADAITIIYNPSIGVTELNLTAQQVKQIFEAAAQNEGSIPWSNYVPGASGTITVFSRESGSGTRGDFQEAFGIDNTIMNGALVASSNGQMVTDVSTTSGGIGYCGFAYYTPSGLPAANIAYNSTYDFYAPSIESITSWAQFQLTAGPSPGVQPSTVIYGGTGYFACRFIYYLTNGFPARGSLADKWLGYVLSPAGQHVVDTTGYVSMQTIGYLWPAQQWN